MKVHFRTLLIILQSLTVVLSPLYIIRAHLIIPTTLLEITLLATCFLTGLDFLRSHMPFYLLKSKFNFFILLFLLAAIVAEITSYDKVGGLGILKAYFFEPVLFFYCLLYTAKKYTGKFIIPSLLFTAGWLSAMGLIQKLTGGFSLAPNEIAQGRVSAVFNSANDLALFLGPIIAICFALFIVNTSKRKATFFLLFSFFILVVVWTRSRGGLIAALLSLSTFAYAVISLKNKFLQRVWFLLPVIIFFVIGVFLFIEFRTYSIFPTTYGKPYTQGDTLQIRYFIWAGTVNMLKDHPFFGAGLNGFKTLYASGYRLPQYSEDFQYPHNLLLTFWTETGFTGLFSFLLILVGSFGLIIRSLLKNKNQILGIGLLAALSYVVIHGVVDVPYFKNDLSVEFWILIVLIELWSEEIPLE